MSWLVLGAGEDAESSKERLESFATEETLGSGTKFEFQEWTGARMVRTTVSSEAKPWDERALRGLRVLVFDSEPERASAMAAEMKKHYALVAVRPPEAGLGMDRDLDPEVIIVDTDGMDRGALEVLEAVHQESRLRWVQVVLVDWSEADGFDDVGFGHVAAAVGEGLELQGELISRGEAGEPFEFPIQALGPHRTVRTLSNLEGVWSVSFSTGSGTAELNLTEGLLVGARMAEASGPQERPEGLEAVRAALGTSAGRIDVRPITDAHIANVMSPVDETFDEALSSAPREPAVGLPADPPPILGADAPTIPKTTLLGVAPPELPGLDEPFTGPGSELPPPPSSPLPPLPESIARTDPFTGAGPSSGSDPSAAFLESAPPDIELISEPPGAMPPAPPPGVGTDDTVKTQAISLDEDGEIEDMPTLAIPQISLDDDAIAESDDDGMEALAAAARDAAKTAGADEDRLDRYSAYPTMRAPSLVDAEAEAQAEAESADEVDFDDEDHPTQAMAQVPSDESEEEASENADGVFPTVRLSQLDLDAPDESPAPLSAPMVSESVAAPSPPTDSADEESLSVPSFVTQTPEESGGSSKWVWPLVFLAALAVVWIITLGHEGDENDSTAASTPASSSAADPAPATPEVPSTQPATQENAASTGTVPAPEIDASAEPSAEATDAAPEPLTPDAEVAEAPAPDAEVAAATPDAAVPDPEPVPAEPTPTPPTPVASGSSLPTPDSLPDCPANIRRTSRWSRTLSGRGLDALDAGNLAAARAALDESICADRRNPHAVIGFARLALARGQAAVAVTWAEEACRLRRRRAEYQVIRGDALLANGDQTEARNAWRQALSIEPRNRDARDRLQSNPE